MNIGIVVNILIGKDNNIDAEEIGVVHTVKHHINADILNPRRIPFFIP